MSQFITVGSELHEGDRETGDRSDQYVEIIVYKIRASVQVTRVI